MDPKTTLIVTGACASIAGIVVGYIAGRLSAGSAGSTNSDSGSNVKPGDGIELYVGNLSYDVGEKEIMKVFGAYGTVLSARIIKNKFNNRSKGYGFVEMANAAGVDKAVQAMHGAELKGRKLVVNEARSRSHE